MNVNNYNSLSSSILQIVNSALSILHLPKSRCPQMRFISAELKIEEGPFLRKGRCSAVVRVPESRNKGPFVFKAAALRGHHGLVPRP